MTRTLPPRLAQLCAELGLSVGESLVDYGCADMPYRRAFRPEVRYVGADIEGNPHADIVLTADGELPCEDDMFDAVLSTQVLEHVEDPRRYLKECCRVLRPGGRLLLSTHGMMLYHPDPDDYWRWTCAGLQKAVTEAGFEIEAFEGIIGVAATGLQLVQDAVHGRLPRRLRALWALIMQTLMTVADRLEPTSGRQYNALVFAIIAVKR